MYRDATMSSSTSTVSTTTGIYDEYPGMDRALLYVYLSIAVLLLFVAAFCTVLTSKLRNCGQAQQVIIVSENNKISKLLAKQEPTKPNTIDIKKFLVPRGLDIDLLREEMLSKVSSRPSVNSKLSLQGTEFDTDVQRTKRLLEKLQHVSF